MRQRSLRGDELDDTAKQRGHGSKRVKRDWSDSIQQQRKIHIGPLTSAETDHKTGHPSMSNIRTQSVFTGAIGNSAPHFRLATSAMNSGITK
jgi:hypothetical protein